MAINEIGQQEFNDLNLPETCHSSWIRIHECSWFRDDTGTVLGVILFNPETGYWGYVMCAHVGSGDFKRLGVGADFKTLTLAQRDLIASMERHVARNHG